MLAGGSKTGISRQLAERTVGAMAAIQQSLHSTKQLHTVAALLTEHIVQSWRSTGSSASQAEVPEARVAAQVAAVWTEPGNSPSPSKVAVHRVAPSAPQVQRYCSVAAVLPLFAGSVA